MSVILGLATGAVVGFTVNAVSVHGAGEWLVWLAAAVAAAGFLIVKMRKATKALTGLFHKVDDAWDSYPRVREMVQTITEHDLPNLSNDLGGLRTELTRVRLELSEIKNQGSAAAAILAAAVDTGETPIITKEHP